jgi:hypothetical protein
MALCVPAIGWIQESMVVAFLAVLVLIVIAVVLWWIGSRKPSAPQTHAPGAS